MLFDLNSNFPVTSCFINNSYPALSFCFHMLTNFHLKSKLSYKLEGRKTQKYCFLFVKQLSCLNQGIYLFISYILLVIIYKNGSKCSTSFILIFFFFFKIDSNAAFYDIDRGVQKTPKKQKSKFDLVNVTQHFGRYFYSWTIVLNFFLLENPPTSDKLQLKKLCKFKKE